MTEGRKADHVDICLTKPVDAKYNYWDDVQLLHLPLPELNFEDIDTRIELFNKKLEAPIIISAMTGGFKTEKYDSEKINGNLAKAAAELGIGLGVGSQRAAVIEREHESTFSIIKEHKVPLVLGNIGAPQLVQQKGEKKPLSKDDLQYAMDLIGADVMAVHLNYLQEVCMVEGDLNGEGLLDTIKLLAKDIPIVAKETGAGMSREAAMLLMDAGVAGIDVGGVSGTSFAAVEKHRAELSGDKTHARISETFWNWGTPTPIAVLESDIGLPMIATGGIRNGLDAAKAVLLGANAGGIAKSLLAAAVESEDAVRKQLETIILELKSAMFLVGARNIEDLTKRKYILTGDTLLWYNQRIIHLRGGL